MAETSEDIRSDIALTRQRMSDTMATLERKVNPQRVIEDHPWAVLAAAVGVGVLLGRGGAERGAMHTIKEATETARKTTSTHLDGLIAGVTTALTAAVTAKVQDLVADLARPSGAAPARDPSSIPDPATGRFMDREIPVPRESVR